MVNFISSIVAEIADWQTPQAAVLMLILIALVTLRPFPPFATEQSNSRTFFLIGVSLLAVGLAPFAIANKIPLFADWGSRLQLLLPLGGSFLLWSVVVRAKERFGTDPATWFALVISLFSAFAWLKIYADFHVDWMKQSALIRKFEISPKLRTLDAILVSDETRSLNALGREYRDVEVAAIARRAIGDEKRFISRFSEFSIFERSMRASVSEREAWQLYVQVHAKYFVREYFMQDVRDVSNPVLVIISPGQFSYNRILLSFRLGLLRLRNANAYLTEIDRLIIVSDPIRLFSTNYH